MMPAGRVSIVLFMFRKESEKYLKRQQELPSRGKMEQINRDGKRDVNVFDELFISFHTFLHVILFIHLYKN